MVSEAAPKVGRGRAARSSCFWPACFRASPTSEEPGPAEEEPEAPAEALPEKTEREFASDDVIIDIDEVIAAHVPDPNLLSAGPTRPGQEAGSTNAASFEQGSDREKSAAALPGACVNSKASANEAGAILEMSGDYLCIRTMTVLYSVGLDKERQTCSRTGYSGNIVLPPSAFDVEVSFSVVGGGDVRKVDREDKSKPWIKDASGRSAQEKFVYTACPEHVQFFLCGSSLHSYVAHVDERRNSESLLEMVSRDFHCIRTMRVDYTNETGERQQWTESGYAASCHLPSSATDVEVSFAVVGGRDIYKVNRHDPQLSWVKDANGQRQLEKFCYKQCPQSAQFQIRGTSLRGYISKVSLQRVQSSTVDSLLLSRANDAPELFEVQREQVPAIGGLVDLQQPHSEYLLPPEVLLFEPTAAEVFRGGEVGKPGTRQIFLNTPLTEAESASLGEFRTLLAKKGVIASATDPLPRYMATHSLRLLQTCKYNAEKAADMMKTAIKERLHRLPIVESDVSDDLKNGFVYFHGRDRKGRPCLVLRMERLGPMVQDKERAVRTVMFALEYVLRFAMVPGRVENWVVIMDLANVSSIISPLRVPSLASTGAAIGTALEKVYCGRMVWLKIVNMPSVMARAINSVIPAEKKHKVSFPTDAAAELAPHFEPNQLERRYGGTAPDVQAVEAYPFRFFPNCTGEAAYRTVHRSGEESAEGEAKGNHPESEDCSMHESTGLAFHEGLLWDESSEEARARWLEAARTASLAPEAARALAERAQGFDDAPCRDMSGWMDLVNPDAKSSVGFSGQ